MRFLGQAKRQSRALHALRLVEMTLDGAVDDIGRGDLKFVFNKRFHGLVAG